MQDKNSFILYADQKEVIDKLTDEQAGKLMKAVYQYVDSGTMPELDTLLEIAMIPIKQKIDKNNEKWQEEKEKRSDAGKKGMAKRWQNSKNKEQCACTSSNVDVKRQLINNTPNLNDIDMIPTLNDINFDENGLAEPTDNKDNNVIDVITNDNKDNNVINPITNITDNVHVSVHVIEKEIKKEKAKAKTKKEFSPPTLEDVQAYCLQRQNGVDAKKFYDYYSSANWRDSTGKPVLNWKQKMIANWEKDSPKKQMKWELIE